FSSPLGSLRSASVESSLAPTDRGVDEVRDFVERVIEHVLQQHTRALLGRERQHEVLDRAFDARSGGLDRCNGIGYNGCALGATPNAAAGQEGKALVMGGPKQ